MPSMTDASPSRNVPAHCVMPPGFDPQPTLEGPTIRLRPLRAEDREAVWGAIRDPAIWAQHPAKRHERAVFDPYFDFLVGTGGALIVEEGGRTIGISRFYAEPPDGTPDGARSPDERVSIGFTFLVRDRWGGRTNAEMKGLMLDHLFTPHATYAGRDAAWLHIAPDNVRSQRATARLGAVHVRDAVLATGGASALAQCWRLDRAAWEASAARAGLAGATGAST